MPLTIRRTSHRITIDAPADLIFAMLRSSSHWPYLDGLTVYSERVSGDDASHDLRTSVVANGSLNSSHSQRTFDLPALRADFRQVDLEPPLLSLSGGWSILRTDKDGSEVTLTHEFEVCEETDVLTEQIHRIIDEYSRRELEALRLSSERLSLLVLQHSSGDPATVTAGGR